MGRQAATAEVLEVPEARQALILTVFKGLPLATRKKLNFDEVQSLAGAVRVEDAIHDAYSQCAHIVTELLRKKRSLGFCGGEPSCLNYVGFKDAKGNEIKHILCSTCRAKAKQRREGIHFAGPHPRKLSPYGKIRALHRAEEKRERARLNGGPA